MFDWVTWRMWIYLLCVVRYVSLISCVSAHFWGFLLPYLSSLPLNSSCKGVQKKNLSFWTSSGRRFALCSPVSWLLVSPILLTWSDVPLSLNWLFLLYFWCHVSKTEDYILENGSTPCFSDLMVISTLGAYGVGEEGRERVGMFQTFTLMSQASLVTHWHSPLVSLISAQPYKQLCRHYIWKFNSLITISAFGDDAKKI